MDPCWQQVLLAGISPLGICLGWLSGHRGQRRIRQPLAAVITNDGVFVIVVPWVIMPLLLQPRITGPARAPVFFAGILLLAAFIVLEIWATPFIFPAAKKGGDELDPAFLVQKGPYRHMRHPQYVAAVTGFIGWAFLQGAVYSLLLSPVMVLVFRAEAYLEERYVLEPKFSDEFRKFKREVPAAFFGRAGTLILAAAYVLFLFLVVTERMPYS